MTIAFDIQASRGALDLALSFSSEARIVAIEGASGAGKTTLLKGLAGLIPVSNARLKVDERLIVDTANGLSPPPHLRRIGFVFQDARLFPHLSVADNVGFGRRYAEAPMTVSAALSLVDMEGFSDRWPASLSGGEIRRVAIARALCAAPQILFLDEPFAGLDAARRSELTHYLLRLREETGLTMLLVSHDPRDVEMLAEASVHIGDFTRLRR